MSRKRAFMIAAAVLALAAAAVVVWVLTRPDGEDGGDGASPPASEAEEVVQALEVLETEPEQLLPSGLEGSVDLATALPPGTEVSADPSTWTPSAAGGGLIEMTLTLEDGSTQRVLAVLAQEGERWTILQTVPLEGEG